MNCLVYTIQWRQTIRFRECAANLYTLESNFYKRLNCRCVDVQWTRLGVDLDRMMVRQRRMKTNIAGDLAIAGRLTSETLLGTGGAVANAAVVHSSTAATIQFGAHVVHTKAGAESKGRTKDDHFVYVPFFKRSGKPEACVMRIKQILLIRKVGMGWVNDEARIAIGRLIPNLQVRSGPGLEDTFNDDPVEKATCVPRLLYASEACLNAGYTWAVLLRQIHCPVCYFKQMGGITFITVSKMGYHGKRDVHWRENPQS